MQTEDGQERSRVKDFVFGNDDSAFYNAVDDVNIEKSFIKQRYMKHMNKSLMPEDVMTNYQRRQLKFESRDQFSHFICVPLWHLQSQRLVNFRVTLFSKV